MKSMFSLQEVGEMLDMSVDEVRGEIEQGYLNYSFENGKKMVTLYDLEKYMGAEQTRQITQAYLNGEEE